MTVTNVERRQLRARRDSGAEEHLAAIMAVSAAVAEAGALDETLNKIARTAARLARAKAAAIILRAGESMKGLGVAGSYGLSPTYFDHLNARKLLQVGTGPSGLAAKHGRPVIIRDVLEDEIFSPWRDVALSEHYRSMVSVPLRPKDGAAIGVLNAYRTKPGTWTQRELGLLELLADHATIAIRTAHLLDESRRQVDGLSLMLRSLRAQTHEHSNRLHAIYGLLALNEVEAARKLIADVEAGYHSLYGRVIGRIDCPAIAGFLLAEFAVARESGIHLTLDTRSRLLELPPGLGELDAITILGNLVQNATEAVSTMPLSRRRVSVKIGQGPREITFRIRDWGPGLAPEDVERIFESDFSTKADHGGIGLALVRSIVDRACGRIEVEHPRGGGVAITVSIPR
jgi:GAF domain-containing protein